jgi:small subunit ribosomal protein S6
MMRRGDKERGPRGDRDRGDRGDRGDRAPSFVREEEVE